MSVTTIDLASLTRKQNPVGSDILHLKDPITGKDHYVLLSDIQTGNSYDSWDPEIEYSIGDRVTFGFRLWESLQNANEGNTPQEGAWWKEVSESAKPDKLEKVIAKSAHGFVAGNVLTLDGTGVLVKVSAPTQKWVGLVTEVIDVNNFKIALPGGYVTELAGLTPGSIHYGQTDGTISTVATDMAVLFADSTGSGFLLTGVGASSLYGNLVGLHNASTGIPVTGTGPGGAIRKGDYWLISVAGTIAGIDGVDTLQQFDTLYAKQDGANAAGHFFGMQTNVDQASETEPGILEIINQTEAETVNGTVGTLDHVRAVTLRAWRWAWDKMLTVSQSVTGLWTFSKAKITHGALGYTILTDADTITWNADIGNIAQVTLGGNRTLAAITNPQTGGIYILRVVQDGTGGRTLTFNAAYTFPQTANSVINGAAGGVTTFIFAYTGTSFRFIAGNGQGKLNIGSNTAFETLGDSSDVYRFALLSRLGAVFKTLGMEWDEATGELRFDGTAAIIRAGEAVTDGNFYVKLIQDALRGFSIQDDDGELVGFGVDADGVRKIFTSVGFKRIRGSAALEDGFIAQQVEGSTTTTLRTIPLPNNSSVTIDVFNINCYNASNDILRGRAQWTFKNVGGTLTQVSTGSDALEYGQQWSTIKGTDGYVTNSDTRFECVISGTNILIQFINTEAQLVQLQAEFDYNIANKPTA